VAIPWHELWYAKLDDAWKLYSSMNDVDGMRSILLDLHKQISKRNTITIIERPTNTTTPDQAANLKLLVRCLSIKNMAQI